MLRRLIKLLFTWWNGKTVGTLFYTWKNGTFVGNDIFGNKYYKNKKNDRRWVIYNDVSEGSKIDPSWHGWLRFTREAIPEKDEKKHKWQKSYVENLTGLASAYKPNKENLNVSDKKFKYGADYTSWKP